MFFYMYRALVLFFTHSDCLSVAFCYCVNNNVVTSTPISSSDVGGGSGKRVTFLVNVWLNHTPRSASPLPAEKASTLGFYDKVFNELFSFSSTGVNSFVPPRIFRVCHTEAFSSEPGTGDGLANDPGDGTIQEDCGSKKGDDGESCSSKGKSVQGIQDGVSDAVGMKWEFGEVGDEAEEQVHVRHEVFIPVPVELTPAGAGRRGFEDQEAVGGNGGSFCVEYVGGVKPRVGVCGIDGSSDSDDSDDSDDSELEGDD